MKLRIQTAHIFAYLQFFQWHEKTQPSQAQYYIKIVPVLRQIEILENPRFVLTDSALANHSLI